MEFDLQWLCLLVGYATLYVCHIADTNLSTRQQHPRLPAVVTRTAQSVVRVLLRGSHVDTQCGQGLHRAHADVRLLRAVLAQMLRHDTDQRTCGTAVRLDGWQFDLDKVSLRHFIFVFVVV